MVRLKELKIIMRRRQFFVNSANFFIENYHILYVFLECECDRYGRWIL
jgi:hypothetical protein